MNGNRFAGVKIVEELNDIMIPSHALKTSVVIGGMIYRKRLTGLSTKSRLLAG